MTDEDEDWNDNNYELIHEYSYGPPVELPEPTIRLEEVATRKPRPRLDDVWLGQVFTDHMAMLDCDERGDWTDPRIVPFQSLTVHPAAPLLRGGQTIFDGIMAFRGWDGEVRLFRPHRHCQRLAEGAQRLRMPPIESRLLLPLLKALVTVDLDWVPCRPGTGLYLRLTVMATEPYLGARPSKRYLLFAIASPSGWNRFPLLPRTAWIGEGSGSLASGGSGAVKSAAHYAGRLEATEDAKERGFSGVLWTSGHHPPHLLDLGTTNLFLVLGDEVVTPPLDGNVVDGVTRDTLLFLCRSSGRPTTERHVTVEELLDAGRTGRLREMFGCSTSGGIVPISELAWPEGHLAVNGGQPGDLTRELFETLTNFQSGRVPDLYRWLTPVG